MCVKHIRPECYDVSLPYIITLWTYMKVDDVQHLERTENMMMMMMMIYILEK
jgi:hypothetical protein